MNIPFTVLLRERGYNQNELAAAIGMPYDALSRRINGTAPWKWKDACNICAALDITLDQFAEYFPCGTATKKSPQRREQTRQERIDSVLAELREILM